MNGTAQATTVRTATLVAVLTLAVLAEPAAATTTAGQLPTAGLDPVKWVSDGLDKMKDVVLGPLKLGAKEIAQLIGTIVLAILDMLVPDWIINAGPKVIAWIVEVENWGASNGKIYRSINGLQGTLKWVGIALMTSGGTWSALRVLAGHEAIEDAIRAWGTALLGILLFRWGWGQATAVTNSVTDLILTQPGVATGLTALVTVVGGTAVATSGGLVLPLLMIVAVIVFIGLLAAKTMLLIVGAIVYVTGQFAFALRVWPAGHAILKAWWSLAAAVFLIPLAWTLIFAVGGVMIVDALRVGAGGVIEADAGKVFQSWMLAIAAIVTILAAIKAAQAIFAMAKTAPLALISTMGTGGLTATASGSSSQNGAGGRSAGQAAQALRSSSERSMDSASVPATGGAPTAVKQEMTVRAAQAAGTYLGGPAAGAAAAAVTQQVVAKTQGAGQDQVATTGGEETTPGSDLTPPGAASAAGDTTTVIEPAAAAAAAEPQNSPAIGEADSGQAQDTAPPEKAVQAAAAETAPAAAAAAEPVAEAAGSGPPPAGEGPSGPPASNGAPMPQPGAPTEVSGAPAEPVATQVAASPPSAPAAANRSIAGLPTGNAHAAFGAPDTKQPEQPGTAAGTPDQTAQQQTRQEPRTDRGGGGER